MIYGAIKRSQIVDYPLRKFGNHLVLGLPKISSKKGEIIFTLNDTINQILYVIRKASKRKFLCMEILAMRGDGFR